MFTPKRACSICVLDDSVFAREDGHLFACCPQVKKPKDIERLWKGVNDGEVCVDLDGHMHIHESAESAVGRRLDKDPDGPARSGDAVAAGVHARRVGQADAARTVRQKCCTNPAKIMGLYPQKGVLAAGSDADIAIFDPDKKIDRRSRTMETGADWNPYQGMQLAGFAEHTFSRGKQIVQDYKCIDDNGWGKWLPRERAGSLN